MWNTGGTREIATTPDNGKSQLVERDENPLEYSSLNLLEKVKFNSGGACGRWFESSHPD